MKAKILKTGRLVSIERAEMMPDVKTDAEVDLYPEAIAFAYKYLKLEPPGQTTPSSDMESVAYWAAWYAARRASTALLDEAQRIGCTEVQLEALRHRAAVVAYD